jgi:hypothetical protein
MGPAGPTGPKGPAGDGGTTVNKASIYTTTVSGWGTGGIATCTSVNDVVLTGMCSMPGIISGVVPSTFGAANPTEASLQSGWECDWVNYTSTSMYYTVTAVCLTIP